MTRLDWRGEIVLRRPLTWRAFAAWATLFPLILLHAVVRKAGSGEFWEALSILFFMSGLVAAGLWFWVRVRRKIVVRAGGIDVMGTGATSMRWSEVDSIEGLFVERIELKAKDGRRISVDRAMRGWQTFLRELPDLVEPETRAMAERAVHRVFMAHERV
jgi:hypothetical protein